MGGRERNEISLLFVFVVFQPRGRVFVSWKLVGVNKIIMFAVENLQWLD